MTINVKIKTDTPTGKRLENELRQYPLINADSEIGKALVRKLESHRKVVKIEYPFPVDSHGNEIETISVAESAKLAFERLGEKYNCKFENKYTLC